MLKGIKSFTLMEITIVVVLIGILIGFAIPNYGKAISKADERHGITNLIATRSAVKFYLANTGDATIQAWGNAAAINTALGINILDSKMAYVCAAANNTCSTTHPDGWTLQFHLTGAHNTDGSIHCVAANCPSCPQGGAGDCG